MKKITITEEGLIQVLQPDDQPVMTTKAFSVEKGGTTVYFGSLRHICETIVDIGVTESYLYKRDWANRPYTTRSGYHISRLYVRMKPTVNKRRAKS